MTAETKFTPGPWSADKCRSGWAVYAYGSGDAVVRTEDDEGRYGAIDKEADAHLIAVAPELYEELVQAVIQMEMAAECIEKMRYDEALLHVSSMMRTKRTALAKARGE